MTNQLALRLLLALEATNRRLDLMQGVSGEWVAVPQAMETYKVSREQLRRLAREGRIEQAPELPVRYRRDDLDRHFFGYTRSMLPQWIAEERAQ